MIQVINQQEDYSKFEEVNPEFVVDSGAVDVFNLPISDPSSGIPIILALQYWNGDREQAIRLARLMADVEREKRSDVVFLFVHRMDAQPPDKATIEHVATKFPRVHVHKGVRPGAGHPAGCNSLWTDVALKLYSMQSMAKYAWTFEADNVPIRRDWINRLKQEMVLMEATGAMVGGFYHAASTKPLQFEHINGNMLVRCDFAQKFQQIFSCPPNIAWDIYMARHVLPYARPGGWIYNAYRQIGWHCRDYFSKQCDGAVLVHGIRDNSGTSFVRKIISFDENKTFFEIEGRLETSKALV